MGFKTELRRDYRANADQLINCVNLLKTEKDEKKIAELNSIRASCAHQLVHLADLMETCD